MLNHIRSNRNDETLFIGGNRSQEAQENDAGKYLNQEEQENRLFTDIFNSKDLNNLYI